MGWAHRKFIENYAFTSTSSAGAVVKDCSTAGPLAWKLKGTGEAHKDWEVEGLSEHLL